MPSSLPCDALYVVISQGKITWVQQKMPILHYIPQNRHMLAITNGNWLPQKCFSGPYLDLLTVALASLYCLGGQVSFVSFPYGKFTFYKTCIVFYRMYTM